MRLRLPTGSFAFVMATGIVSLAAVEDGKTILAAALFALAGSAYVLLVLAVRPRLGFALFSFTAAGDVLAARLASEGWETAALALWALDGVAWLAISVALLRRFLPRSDARGEWLLAVVSTQSLAVVAGVLSERSAVRGAAPVAVALVALGIALYPPVLALLTARLARALRGRARLAPDDWIAMGALAISSLAAAHAPVPDELALALWAVASAWIPPLALAELRGLRSVRYEARRWSMVFPLGMYASASFAVGLADIGAVAFWVALVVWSATAAGLVLDLRAAGPSPPPAPPRPPRRGLGPRREAGPRGRRDRASRPRR